MKNRVNLSILLMAGLLLFAACLSPWNGSDETTLSINTGGRYVLDLDGVGNELNYTVTIQGPTNLTVHGTGKTTFNVTVTPGKYTIRVEAYLDGILYAAGTTALDVKAGQDNLARVMMTYAEWDTYNPRLGAYVITRDGTGIYTAVKSGVPIGTGAAIQDVIDSIRDDADGAPCVIQFGDGTTALGIGSTNVEFNNTGGTWGAVRLSGKIASTGATGMTGIIVITGTVSVTSTADIAYTGTIMNVRAIYFNSTGTLTISGGTVSAAGNSNSAVHSQSAGLITVSGTAKVTSAYANPSNGTIHLASNGTGGERLRITGGTVENTATVGCAIYNASAGTVTISGGTVSTAGTAASAMAVYNISTGTVNITGGTVEATGGGIAVQNNLSGTVTISGGTVSATGSGGSAVYNNASATGLITVSGTALVTSANTGSTSGTIHLANTTSSGTLLEMTGGTVENTASGGYAIYHAGTNTARVIITDGEVKGGKVGCP